MPRQPLKRRLAAAEMAPALVADQPPLPGAPDVCPLAPVPHNDAASGAPGGGPTALSVDLQRDVPPEPAPGVRSGPSGQVQPDPRPVHADMGLVPLSQPTQQLPAGQLDSQPHITAEQLRWLTYRLESGDNLEACTRSDIDPLTVLGWLGDADFRAVFDQALSNKKEAFPALTSHLLPAVIRSLQSLLDTGSNKDKKEAATLVMRAQGLLIDRQNVIDRATISDLFSLLREEKTVEPKIIDMTNYRSLEPGEQ